MPGECQHCSGPRCAVEGCTAKADPDPDLPCVYVCTAHATMTPAERLGAFRRAIRAREEMERAAP
jgi:hypothetical protein